MTEKLNKIQQSFTLVYGPISKAIGDCLMGLENKDIDATAVISAIVSVAIDIAAKATKLARVHGNIDMLVDANQLARFLAFTMVNTLELSDDIRIALDGVVQAGRNPPATAPGSSQLN